MQNYLNIAAKLVFQKAQPLQAVGAFKNVIAEPAAVRETGRGVVRAEDIKAAAVVIFVKHAGSLRVLGVIAVDDKRDLFAEFFAAGEIKALQGLAAL